MPDIIVNGCYASAELPAIDNYIRYGVYSDNLNGIKKSSFADNYLDNYRYTVSECAEIFQITQKHAKVLLQAAGYQKRICEIYFRKNYARKAAIEECMGRGLDDGVFIKSMHVGEKKYLMFEYTPGYEIKIQYEDIYGNRYYQRFEPEVNENKIWFNARIPELILRTDRVRYQQ